MIKLRVIEGPTVSDQIAFCAFYSFLVEVQTGAGYIHVTHLSTLEIRIAGSSCHPRQENTLGSKILDP